MVCIIAKNSSLLKHFINENIPFVAFNLKYRRISHVRRFVFCGIIKVLVLWSVYVLHDANITENKLLFFLLRIRIFFFPCPELTLAFHLILYCRVTSVHYIINQTGNVVGRQRKTFRSNISREPASISFLPRALDNLFYWLFFCSGVVSTNALSACLEK